MEKSAVWPALKDPGSSSIAVGQSAAAAVVGTPGGGGTAASVVREQIWILPRMPRLRVTNQTKTNRENVSSENFQQK